LQLSYLYSKLDQANLKFASQTLNDIYKENPNFDPYPDEFMRVDYSSKSQFDPGFGFVGYTPNLYFGLAVHHLLPLRTDFFKFSKQPANKQWALRWTAHIGGKVTIKQKVRNEIDFGDIYFYPNMVFISQGKFHYLHDGFYFQFYPFTIGGWLRHNFKNVDAFIVTCGIEHKSFRIGYSYDFNLTKLERTGGSHEVSLQFYIPCSNSDGVKKTRKRFVPLECPKF
jgi:type IX secretion system PorP/SprF family membrane protein